MHLKSEGRWVSRRGPAILLAGLFLLAAAVFLGILRRPNPKLGTVLTSSVSVAHPAVAEASGLVQSAHHPERLWLHNDSGDVPRIFAMTAGGKVIVPESLAKQGVVAHSPRAGERLYQGIAVANASLRDWEDIARHGDRLYIADMGNNFNQRRDLGVYEIPEPDPEKVESVSAGSFIRVAYPDQTGFPPTDRWDFDCEAMFWWGEHLYFITKTRPAFRIYVQGSAAALYRLDTHDLDKVNTLTRVDEAEDLGGWVTAADSSQDGRYVAVLVESPVQSVWLFEQPAQGDRFFSEPGSVRRLVFHGGGQLESLAFRRDAHGKEEILLLNEARNIFHLTLENFAALDPDRK